MDTVRAPKSKSFEHSVRSKVRNTLDAVTCAPTGSMVFVSFGIDRNFDMLTLSVFDDGTFKIIFMRSDVPQAFATAPEFLAACDAMKRAADFIRHAELKER